MEDITQADGTLTATVLSREKRSKEDPKMMKKVMGSHHGHLHQRLGRNTKFEKKETPHFIDDDNDGYYDDDDDDEKVGIEKRILALKRLVPGGETLGIDKLFEETAGYILALQDQVNTMKALASFFEELEKKKRKFGG